MQGHILHLIGFLLTSSYFITRCDNSVVGKFLAICKKCIYCNKGDSFPCNKICISKRFFELGVFEIIHIKWQKYYAFTRLCGIRVKIQNFYCNCVEIFFCCSTFRYPTFGKKQQCSYKNGVQAAYVLHYICILSIGGFRDFLFISISDFMS